MVKTVLFADSQKRRRCCNRKPYFGTTGTSSSAKVNVIVETMVPPHPIPPQQPKESIPRTRAQQSYRASSGGGGGLASFWNACGDVRNACTGTDHTNAQQQPPPPLSSFFHSARRHHRHQPSNTSTTTTTTTTQPDYYTNSNEYVDNEEEDDDSIVDQERQQQQRQWYQPAIPQPQPTTTTTNTSAPDRVRNIVDGFMAPFMQCVQPPIQACITPVESWDMSIVDMNDTNENAPRHRSNSNSNSNSNSTVQQQQQPRQHSVTSTTMKCSPGNSLKHPSAAAKRIISSSHTKETTTNHHEPTTTTTTTATCYTNHTTTMGSAHINVNDVLCGRGNGVNNHVGNVQFRALVLANKDTYTTLTKKEKIMWARHIVDLVLDHTDPPGRFVARDNETGLWYDIGLPRSVEKTSQALREKSTTTTTTTAGTTTIERVNNDADKVIESNQSSNHNNHTGYLRHAPSNDENDNNNVDDIEVTPFTEKSSSSWNQYNTRATTITVNHHQQHRNGKQQPIVVVVPDHLRSIFQPNPICKKQQQYVHSVQQQQPQQLRPTYPIAVVSPHVVPTTATSSKQQQHLVYPGFGGPRTPPYVPAAAFNSPELSHCTTNIKPPFPPSPCPAAYLTSLPSCVPSFPNLASVRLHPTSLPRALVTPSGMKSSNHHVPPPSSTTPRVMKSDNHCMPPTMVEMSGHNYNPTLSTIWNHEQHDASGVVIHVVDAPRSPLFPSDVFQNPKFVGIEPPAVDVRNNNNNTSNTPHPFNYYIETNESPATGIMATISSSVTISPSREQQCYPKRQRLTSKHSNNNNNNNSLLDFSFDSACIDVDTSQESIETSFDTAFHNHNNGTTTGTGTSNGTTTTHRLVEAIGTQLTLHDDSSSGSKVIQSPSGMIQTYTRGRKSNNSSSNSIQCLLTEVMTTSPERRTTTTVHTLPRSEQSLPRPFKATPALDISADSMDGLAALSTAAYLRLDESF